MILMEKKFTSMINSFVMAITNTKKENVNHSMCSVICDKSYGFRIPLLKKNALFNRRLNTKKKKKIQVLSIEKE